MVDKKPGEVFKSLFILTEIEIHAFEKEQIEKKSLFIGLEINVLLHIYFVKKMKGRKRCLVAIINHTRIFA